MVLTEIHPFFYHAAIGQMAFTMFPALRIFFDYRFTALLHSKFGSGIGYAHSWRFRLALLRTSA